MLLVKVVLLKYWSLRIIWCYFPPIFSFFNIFLSILYTFVMKKKS